MPVTFAEQHRGWHVGMQAVIAKARGRRRVQSRQPDPMDLVTIFTSVSWNAKCGGCWRTEVTWPVLQSKDPEPLLRTDSRGTRLEVGR